MFTGYKIKKIIPVGELVVCDITVDGDQSYVGNGIVNHNSSKNPNMQNIPRTCIAQDQKILTHRGWEEIGKYVPLSIGTMELPYLMVKTHTGKWKRALEGVNKGQEEMFEVEFESGEKLVCTKAHRMLTKKGWKSLADILIEGLTVKAWKQ